MWYILRVWFGVPFARLVGVGFCAEPLLVFFTNKFFRDIYPVEDTNPIQFFTATILQWKHLLKPDKYKYIIIESLRFLTNEKRAAILGFTIMPNHIHIIWKILSPHHRANVQRDFLKFTAHQVIKNLELHYPSAFVYVLTNELD